MDGEGKTSEGKQFSTTRRLTGENEVKTRNKCGHKNEFSGVGAWYNSKLNGMDKALRLVGKLKNELVGDEELARAAWRAAVGERIEKNARFRELVRDRIVVEVDDRVWQSQMHALERQILGKIEKLLGRVVARQIEYRIAIPRIQPQVAGQVEFQLRSVDAEADRIADPGLRRMYLKSKRRAKILKDAI